MKPQPLKGKMRKTVIDEEFLYVAIREDIRSAVKLFLSHPWRTVNPVALCGYCQQKHNVLWVCETITYRCMNCQAKIDFEDVMPKYIGTEYIGKVPITKTGKDIRRIKEVKA